MDEYDSENTKESAKTEEDLHAWCILEESESERGRTHHHIAKQKSEDKSRRPILAMDYFFKENGICPECRIDLRGIDNLCRNIMSSVALKKGVEEPWAIERVVKNSLTCWAIEISR